MRARAHSLSKDGPFVFYASRMTQLAHHTRRVYLVGAGPGDPGLITVRGSQVLAAAEVVFYDYLVNPDLLKYTPSSTELIGLGNPHNDRGARQEEINRRMISAARAGKTVVRLKSGDPTLFGRGGEEAEALARAGIEYEIVPGVTAALAAAGCAGVPITHRELASAVALITGHQRADRPRQDFDYSSLAGFPGTLVFYMGMTSARLWSEALLDGGKSPATPVAIVRRASWHDQQTFRCTLDDVADLIEREALTAPAVIIVGDVAAFERSSGRWSP